MNLLFRYLRTVWLLLIASGATAHNESHSLYYPLPLQEQGLFFTAKAMFPAESGGFWLHDIHGNIRFFDGKHVLPRSGSALDKPVDNVVFAGQIFWYVENNRLYRCPPAGRSEVAAILDIGVELTNIGLAGERIWMTDNKHLYLYHIVTSVMQILPLQQLSARMYANLEITAAVQVNDAWILGTTSGVYIYRDNHMLHARLSGSKHVQVLHYSEARGELLVGGRQGAVLIDSRHPGRIKARIGHSAVQAVTESGDGYWIGTELGLYFYSFSGQQARMIETGHQSRGKFIRSLVYDRQGGLWIATSQEIYYYSQASELFRRATLSMDGHTIGDGVINTIVTDNDGVHWIATEQGLYSYYSGKDHKPVRRLSEPVYGAALYDDVLWLAVDHGIVAYNRKYYRVHVNPEPDIFSAHGVRHVTVDRKGTLWFDSDKGIIRYRIDENRGENLGYEWLTSHSPQAITHLHADTQGRVFIGTEHGTYLYSDERIQYIKSSAVLGQNLSMTETPSSGIWSVYGYGLYRFTPSPLLIGPVKLNEPNIRVLCVLSTARGVWSSSSKGLSFYGYSGELLKHFSAPFGLMNNEFTPDSCSYDPIQDELMFGSRFGLVSAKQGQLLDAELPDSRVLFSQILLNNQPYAIGAGTGTSLSFPYESQLTFMLGVLPDFDQGYLQYRLLGTGAVNWMPLQGNELGFGYLAPGEYKLYVRTEAQATRGETGSILTFRVQSPWYLTSWALSLFSVLAVSSVMSLIYWRSVRVLRLNRYLQELVRLKTYQLEQQSQSLLTVNDNLKQQLRACSGVGRTVSAGQRTHAKNVCTEEQWLEKVFELIENEYMNAEFGTSLASKSLYVSERSLQRKFKSLSGKTFTEQLNQTRLEKACELLLAGRKISDVAFDTGFNDASYFSLRFKNYYGISPSTFVETRSE
ncbi:hypothetical protein CSW98_03475 [Vibrio sp. HA2012]|uniref:ligand-binding sensor domain-containing protein n=1 Tax=Vibrio sp. HA2012 TaxID=1971595 RepID=UPI000C2CB611|nr:AraC family transcriptional regulator [Vibrio sp. HA2012]PJC88193.1 hypothetical protein CSW98_03475 [Vibrio sp. HA2012]